MITVSASEINETTKLKLAIIVKRKEVLRVEKEIQELKEWRIVIKVELERAKIEENSQQIVRITEVLEENKYEIRRKREERVGILRSIQKRLLRLLEFNP